MSVCDTSPAQPLEQAQRMLADQYRACAHKADLLTRSLSYARKAAKAAKTDTSYDHLDWWSGVRADLAGLCRQIHTAAGAILRAYETRTSIDHRYGSDQNGHLISSSSYEPHRKLSEYVQMLRTDIDEHQPTGLLIRWQQLVEHEAMVVLDATRLADLLPGWHRVDGPQTSTDQNEDSAGQEVLV